MIISINAEQKHLITLSIRFDKSSQQTRESIINKMIKHIDDKSTVSILLNSEQNWQIFLKDQEEDEDVHAHYFYST